MGSIEYGVLTFPLVFVLLSLAVMPLIAPKFWQKWENTAFAVISVISILSLYSIMPEANHILKETLIDDYLPFIIMLFTLYILSHGIHIQIRAASHTETTIIFLACSSLFSSLIGTTGASMRFLRPFLEINKDRQYKSHLIIFFIFLVSNIGGLLTPLGDPPPFWILVYISGNLPRYFICYRQNCVKKRSIRASLTGAQIFIRNHRLDECNVDIGDSNCVSYRNKYIHKRYNFIIILWNLIICKPYKICKN